MDDIQKANLLADMKRNPCHYSREIMYEYISSGELTYNDLVSDGTILSDRAYTHILQYPRLSDEQKPLPISWSSTPYSKDGNLDVLLCGAPGVGKRMFLSGLLSLSGQLGFWVNHRQQSGEYAMELQNYSRSSFIPSSSDEPFTKVIEATFRNDREQESPISLIEMSGHQLIKYCEDLFAPAEFRTEENSMRFAELGLDSDAILHNNNRKILFFFIDSKEFCDTTRSDYYKPHPYVRNCDALNILIQQFEYYPSFLRKVLGIHIVLTKSDLWGGNWTFDNLQDKLTEHGYALFIQTLKHVCLKHDINIVRGYQIGIYPFSVGKFMPGDLYEFDETDSLKILRIIKSYVNFPVPKPKWTDKLKIWLNS